MVYMSSISAASYAICKGDGFLLPVYAQGSLQGDLVQQLTIAASDGHTSEIVRSGSHSMHLWKSLGNSASSSENTWADPQRYNLQQRKKRTWQTYSESDCL